PRSPRTMGERTTRAVLRVVGREGGAASPRSPRTKVTSYFDVPQPSYGLPIASNSLVVRSNQRVSSASYPANVGTCIPIVLPCDRHDLVADSNSRSEHHSLSHGAGSSGIALAHVGLFGDPRVQIFWGRPAAREVT